MTRKLAGGRYGTPILGKEKYSQRLEPRTRVVCTFLASNSYDAPGTQTAIGGQEEFLHGIFSQVHHRTRPPLYERQEKESKESKKKKMKWEDAPFLQG